MEGVHIQFILNSIPHSIFPLIMRMPIFDVLCPGHIVHTAYRAGAGFFAAAAFTMHGANVGGGIFLSFRMGFAGLIGGHIAVIMPVLGGIFMAVGFLTVAVGVS